MHFIQLPVGDKIMVVNIDQIVQFYTHDNDHCTVEMANGEKLEVMHTTARLLRIIEEKAGMYAVK